MGRHNKAIFAFISLATVAAQAVIAAHGFNVASISAIIGTVIGTLIVHRIPNSPPTPPTNS